MATASDGSQPTAALAAPETAPTEAPSLDAQEAIAAEQETEAPKVADKVILGPDPYVEKFTDGKIYVTTAGTKEQISEPLYQVFLKQNLKRVASSTVPTALASQPDEDEEPIEWGDMDPSFSRMLQSTPSMFTAYKALRTPKKMAKLDASTSSFQPSTDLPMPEVSPEVKFPESYEVQSNITMKPRPSPLWNYSTKQSGRKLPEG